MIYIDFKPVILLIISLIITIIVYFIYNRRGDRRIRFFVIAAFILYSVVLFNVCILHIEIYTSSHLKNIIIMNKQRYVQLILFETIRNLEIYSYKNQILGNIVLLMPMPIFIKIYKKNYSLLKVVIFGILSSVLIELIQLMLNIIIGYQVHACDIDDLILNSVGIVISSIVLFAITKVKLINKLYEFVVYKDFSVKKSQTTWAVKKVNTGLGNTNLISKNYSMITRRTKYARKYTY